jgi:hypothetical protein
MGASFIRRPVFGGVSLIIRPSDPEIITAGVCIVSSLVERFVLLVVPNDGGASGGAISESCGQIPYTLPDSRPDNRRE